MIQELWLGDCLALMPNIPDASVDMILCDLPYGTTACKWDTIIPFEPLWKQYWRVLKADGAVLLFGSEPFSTLLRYSQLAHFKYDWIVEKSRASNFVHARFQPLKSHEIVSVFSRFPAAQNTKRRMKYYPQMSVGDPYKRNNGEQRPEVLSGGQNKRQFINSGTRCPRSVLYYSWDSDGKDRYHPTQKPVALCEYLIKTYTNEGEVVLDNCMGSGSTLVAAKRLNRQFIGIEKDPEYFKIAKERVEKVIL